MFRYVGYFDLSKAVGAHGRTTSMMRDGSP